jgi:hypothetical protein
MCIYDAMMQILVFGIRVSFISMFVLQGG